jgi:hypothetical protein
MRVRQVSIAIQLQLQAVAAEGFSPYKAERERTTGDPH